jgi:hypothetical protein
MKFNWIDLNGKTTWDGYKILFSPPPRPIESYSLPKNSDASLLPPIPSTATTKSNEYFENGLISFKVKLKESDSSCFLILNHDTDSPLYIGLNFLGNLYAIGTTHKGPYILLNGSGIGSKLLVDKDYELQVNVKGSEVILYVDGVSVCRTNRIVNKSQIAFQFFGSTEIEIKDFKINRNRPKAFIVMQFTEEFNELYKEVIKPVCTEYNLEAIRADDIYTQNIILQDIIKSINESVLVIADITPNNPNVYYEVGYSHAINKPTILLCDDNREQLPFDLKGFRTIFYSNKISGKSKIEETLKKHLENLGFSKEL